MHPFFMPYQHSVSEVHVYQLRLQHVPCGFTFKKIPQKKKSYRKIFKKLSLNVPQQCLCFEKNIMKKTGHHACLGDIMAKLTPCMPVLVIITRVVSSVHNTFCCIWQQGFLR